MESSHLDKCHICFGVCDPFENPALYCQGECKRRVHIRCSQRGTLPGNLVGDVFFDFYCERCSVTEEELFIRQKLPWLTTVVLTLYNLRTKSNGISRRGYFHWKSDISTFININWDQMFGKTVKKKKNWIGTISGTLSHYSEMFFKSGTAELGDQGWWKLIGNDPPEVIVEKYNKILENKKLQAKLKTKSVQSPKPESCISNEDDTSSGTESIKIKETKHYANIKNETTSFNEVPKIPSICEEFSDILDLDIELPNIEDDFPSFNLASKALAEELSFQGCNQLPDIFVSDCYEEVAEVIVEDICDDIQVSHVSMLESQEFNETIKEFNETINEDNITEEINQVKENNEKNNELPPPPPSLFSLSNKRPWPWDESIKLNPDNVRPLMSEREEEFLLQKIEQHKYLLDSAPINIRRLYRKLAVRKLKRQYGLPILNIDTFGKKLKQKSSTVKKKGNIVLDRFISNDISIFFEQRLQGHCEPTSVHSPYTNRLLKPFIRRDTGSNPLWLQVMAELLIKVNSKNPEWKLQSTAPIDYSYIRPQHIPAINSLCTQFFWPGVDLTECLQYPDFTCVVLYKKVVIGFAIMVPDVGYNEAYISFLLVRPEWRKAGIGTFMLYHLIQTCMGKDITLHVSATNPALILYQKFGFKQEEFVQDFYDKYILPSSKESKHALFLRLSR